MNAENTTTQESTSIEITTAPISEPREIMTGPVDTENAVPAKTEKAEDKVETRTEETSSQEDKRTGKVQERIDELTKARRESEREAAYWKARATETSPATKKDSGPPKKEDFATDAEFIDAQVDYKLEKKLTERDSISKATKEVETRATQWNAKLTDARSKIPDFDSLLAAADHPVADHVSELMTDHDDGAILAAYFAKNPIELEKVNNMTPNKAAFRIAELATIATANLKPKPTLNKISSAPPPSKPIDSGSSSAPALEDMDMDQYRAFRKKQGASWA